MIKFFRKIRLKMLGENRVSKYLLYAIGEIVLVVIGILIALSINNWNQNRTNDSKIAAILSQIERELLADAQTASDLMVYWQRQDSTYYVATSDSADMDLFREHYSLRNFTNYSEQNTLQRSGFDLLILNSNLANENLSPLISKMSKMYTYYSQEFEINIDKFVKFQYYHSQLLAQKYDWYHKSQTGDEWLNYLANSAEYKNNMKLYYDNVGDALTDGKLFLRSSVEILQLIQETQTGEKVNIDSICSKVFGPIKSYKIKPYQENIPKSSWELNSPQKLQFRIFTNKTSGPVEFSILLPDGSEHRILTYGLKKNKPIFLANGESFMEMYPTGSTLKFFDANGVCIGFHVTTSETSAVHIE